MIDDWLSKLNSQQREAVLSEGNTAIVAVPGSGKTRCLSVRAALQLKQHPKVGIIAVTFSVDAATELKSRIKLLAGDTRKVTAGTFHALCRKQLDRKGNLGNIISDGSRYSFIKEAMEDCEATYSIIESIGIIDKYKNQLDCSLPPGGEGKLCEAFDAIMHRNHAIDFFDLLRMAVLGMRDGSVSPITGGHLFVDEFQDTDTIQYEWLREHAKYMDVTVVLDDDQTIYAFRDAMGYENYTRFAFEFKAQTIVLNTNYRSKREILNAADKLIQHNKDRVHKEMFAFKGSGGVVEVKEYQTTNLEAEAIVSRVKPHYAQWAVLARTNYQLFQIESELLACENKIPYKRLGGGRGILDKRHVAIYMHILESISKQTNLGFDHSLMVMGLTASERRRLHDSWRVEGIYKGIYSGEIPVGISKKSREKIEVLSENLQGWITTLKRRDKYSVNECIAKVAAWYMTQIMSKDNEEERCVAMVRDTLLKFKGTLNTRLINIRKTKKDTKKALILSTLHGAKGLEFPNVWMCGIARGLMPYEKVPGELKRFPELLAEERRLCYVGITRAENTLVLSYAGKDARPSPFLVESGLIPSEITENGQLAAVVG